ncbi:MAG: class I SAM-dependent methyltransferase [Solidesulfovibrio sp.]
MSHQPSCPVCHAEGSVPFLKRPNHFLSIFLAGENIPDIDVEFFFCPACCHIYLLSAYNDPKYTEIASRLYEQYTLLEQTVRPFPQRDKHYLAAVDFFRHAARPGDRALTILDIGSNRGDFLFLLKEALPNITVQGVEPSTLPFYGVPSINKRFEDCRFNEQFDVIISRHVVEHLAAPHPFIAKATKLLKDDGLLFLEVPNLHYDLPRGIENFIPEHIHHFSQNSLKTLLSYSGLQLIHIDDTCPEGLRLLARKTEDADRNSYRTTHNLPEIQTIAQRHIDGYSAKIAFCTNKIQDAVNSGYRPIFYGFGNVFFCVLAELLKHIPQETFYAKSPIILDDTPSKIGKIFRDIPIVSPADGLQQGKSVVIVCTMNPSHKKLMRDKVATLAPGRSIRLTAWEERAYE